MPLDEMYSMLSEDSRIRIAEDGELYPNFETWFVSNDVEREALSTPLTVTFDEEQIEISPLELQIAYKYTGAIVSVATDLTSVTLD